MAGVGRAVALKGRMGNWCQCVFRKGASPGRRFASFALLALLLLAPASANAAKPSKSNSKIDRALQHASKKASGPQRVIIRVKPGQRVAIGQALKNHGDKVYADHAGIEAFSAEIHPEDLAVLAANGAIERSEERRVGK